jgi:hypothetical protein
MSYVGGGNRWTPCRFLLWGCAIAALSFGTEALQHPLRNNFHEVIPHIMCRSGLPSVVELERYVRDYGICSVVNLRGVCDDDPLYREEHTAARRLGLLMLDLGLWAGRPPPRRKMYRLLDALDHCPAAILVHCSHGGDRTGLAAAMAVLLHTDANLAQARKELSIWYGHNPYGGAICMDHVLDRYEEWLHKEGETHSPQEFRRWLRTAYRPEECR